VQEIETAAADPGVKRLDDRQRSGNGDGGVEGVAARL
jgi:hypothetical protein